MNNENENIKNLLLKNSIFKSAEENELLSLIESAAETKSFRKGETVFSPEFNERKIGIILSGSVSVFKGRAQISTLSQGEIFGAVTLFSKEANLPTVLKAKTLSKIVFFNKESFEELILHNSDILKDFLTYLSERIKFLTATIDFLTAGDCDSKVYNFLLMCEDDGVSQIKNFADTARRLDVSRASLYRALDNLEKSGKILREKKSFYIINKPNNFGKK